MADTKEPPLPLPSAPAEKSQQQQQPLRPKVKSYLHKFYDRSQSKDPTELDDGTGEMRHLLLGKSKGRRGCNLRPVVWKAMLWIGINCLIFGALGLAVAFFLPREPELVEIPGIQGFVRSPSNAEWNHSATVLKYVALGVFGLGAAVTAAGLVLPSLVWRLFDEDVEGNEESCCSSSFAVCRRPQHVADKPAVANTTATATATTATATATMATATVQPGRIPEEGHVTRGQVQ